MDFLSLISPQAVRSVTACSSKKRLFTQLSDIAEQCYGVESQLMSERLAERERLGPTGVGHGIALPHARMPGLSSVKGVFLRIEKAVDFDAVDRLPVSLVFCLLAPEATGVEHLQALALVSRTMRQQDIQDKLRANSDPETLYTVLIEARETQAA